MIKKLIKQTLWHLNGGYKPKQFWDGWAEKFMHDPWQRKIHPQHEWILKKITEGKPETILEVGCGFGRNILFLMENKIPPQKITGVDISDQMVKQARKYINNKHVTLQTADALKLPFENKTFDVVLLHGLFMHVKPENIDAAIKEVLRVTKKAVIAVEQNYIISKDSSSSYTFVHNYKELFRKNEGIIKEHHNNKKIGLDYFLIMKKL